MAKWLAREFDWTTGKYTGNYYNIAQAGVVAVFADSYTGNDTNAGTAAAPFKTLSKAITTLNSTGANGSRIFMNGIFSENLPAQTYTYDYIGCGGGWNGYTIFYYDAVLVRRIRIMRNNNRYVNVRWYAYPDNVLEFHNNTNFATYYMTGCFIENVNTINNNASPGTHFYYCILLNTWCSYISTYYASFCIFYNFRINGSTGNQIVYIYGSSNYIRYSANSLGVIQSTPTDSLIHTQAQNADFIDVLKYNFDVKPTSPLLFSGQLDTETGIRKHIGAVNQGFPYDAISFALTSTGGATLTNLTSDGDKLIRTDPAQNASIVTGYVDFGSTYPITDVSILNNFDFDALGVSKGIFESLTGTPRPTLTVLMKYGNTTAEVDSCPWLEIEYGKRPSYSGTGVNRKGNGDNSFDDTAEQFITARFSKFTISLKNR